MEEISMSRQEFNALNTDLGEPGFLTTALSHEVTLAFPNIRVVRTESNTYQVYRFNRAAYRFFVSKPMSHKYITSWMKHMLNPLHEIKEDRKKANYFDHSGDALDYFIQAKWPHNGPMKPPPDASTIRKEAADYRAQMENSKRLFPFADGDGIKVHKVKPITVTFDTANEKPETLITVVHTDLANLLQFKRVNKYELVDFIESQKSDKVTAVYRK